MTVWRGSVLLACAATLASSVLVPALHAESPTSEQIIDKLTSPSENRARFRDFRGVAVEPDTNAAPAIDLYINFKYNSAELEPEALLAIRSLGQALKSPRLQDAKIAIVGHTDAKGGADYNLKLSERRALAVQNILIGIYEVPASHLVAEGRGARELKDVSRPEDGVNRRVEIKNLGAK